MALSEARVTSLDVARAAGVSRSTVSRILNGVASDMVSEETRARVIRLAAELGYVPNAAARQLRLQRARALGLLLPSIAHDLTETYAFAQQLAGIAEGISADGYSFILCPAISTVQALAMFQTTRIDGALVMHPRVDDPTVAALLAAKAPVVLMNQVPDATGLSWVDIDNLGGARAATRHLIERGHRRIGFIAGRGDYVVTHLRLQGYQEALAASGIAASPNDVALVPEPVLGPEGAAAVHQLLQQPRPPTAFFCAGDVLAVGAMRAVEEAGLRVPDDVALIGFDDEPTSAFQRPPLSTVAAPFRAKGRAAARALIELIEGEQSTHVRLSLPVEVVARGSS